MSSLTFRGCPLCEVPDETLITYFDENRKNNGRKNRIQKKTANLWIGFLHVFDEIEPPMTTRQMFYQMETLGFVPKTQAGYNIVQKQLVEARRAGIIPYNWVSDNTRWMRKPDTYTSLEAFLKQSQEAYRRSIWASQSDYVEIWIEKDALAGVITPITEKWDVPLMVTKGYPSESFVYSAAESIKEIGKPTYIYYFGDWDPSGLNISEDTEKKLKGFLDDEDIPFHFSRVAILEDQIAHYNLPTRFTKKTDSRAKNWKGPSVELDALRADVLREMVDQAIVSHIEPGLYKRTLAIEEAEKETLQKVRLATYFDEVPA